MANSLNAKEFAWKLFDRIVADAAPDDIFTSPWFVDESGALQYEPDYGTLRALAGVPLLLGSKTQSGIPALALDVWVSYELKRAGFNPDAIWPRASHPRVLPAAVSRLLATLPRKESEMLAARISNSASLSGVTSSSANILGKNYFKQVDVIMTDWNTGPEILISTKRMDSSYGNNATNRVEEAYGDAKNLRLRYPLAAHGFLFVVRSQIFDQEPDRAAWIDDLLIKLGREDDAYDATCMMVLEYEDVVEGQFASLMQRVAELSQIEQIEAALQALPTVSTPTDQVSVGLRPGVFLARIIQHVLDVTPITQHKVARQRIGGPFVLDERIGLDESGPYSL